MELVGVEEVNERIRQVALLEPLDSEVIYENAFLWADKAFCAGPGPGKRKDAGTNCAFNGHSKER
ncbi:MAG: hypothetical protein ACPLQO_03235 [Desulfotomaculales bacterium]